MVQLADGSNIPDGFKELKIDGLKLYSDGKRVVICGEPPDEEIDHDGIAHNCDDMGCNWEHVLMSFRSKKGTCNRIYLDWMKKH